METNFNTLYTVLDHAVYSVAAAVRRQPMTLMFYYVIQALFKLKPIVVVLRFMIKNRSLIINYRV